LFCLTRSVQLVYEYIQGKLLFKAMEEESKSSRKWGPIIYNFLQGFTVLIVKYFNILINIDGYIEKLKSFFFFCFIFLFSLWPTFVTVYQTTHKILLKNLSVMAGISVLVREDHLEGDWWVTCPSLDSLPPLISIQRKYTYCSNFSSLRWFWKIFDWNKNVQNKLPALLDL
jgi:hypothetical protein